MRAAERLRALRPDTRPLPGEPWTILVPLLVAQWLAVGVFALTVPRSGWLFYQGGDQTWFYTSGWVLAHGEIPETLVGHFWAMLQTPLAAIFGPNYLAAAPALVLAQFVFLLPLGLLCVYAIAARLGGRLLGYWAASLWIVLPYLTTPLFVERYHERYAEQFLPQALGLTGLADFPSMIALLASAYFTMRALATHATPDAVAAGLLAGTAIGMKPANGLFLFAPFAALALARLWRPGFAFAIALLPSLVTLTLWKYRGSGIALLANEPLELASGLLFAATPDYNPPTFYERLREYVPLDPHQINQHFLMFREFFWSARLLEYGAVAGAIAVVRRSVPGAALLALWLAAFFVIKGSSPAVNIESGTFWRLLMPAFPAYFLLLAGLPLLLPRVGAALAGDANAPVRPLRWRRWPVLTSAGAAVLVPLAVVTLLPSASEARAAKLPHQSLFVPVDESFRPGVEAVEGGLKVSWPAYEGSRAGIFYVVLRAPVEYYFPANDDFVREGLLCLEPGGAIRCRLEMEEVARVRETSVVDRVERGTWTYRIAIAANWLDDPSLGDIFLVGAPLNVVLR